MITEPCVKVNLGLNVLRKRPDGYHDLETLFVPSDEYSDVLEIITGDDWSRTSASLFARYGSDSLSAHNGSAGLPSCDGSTVSGDNGISSNSSPKSAREAFDGGPLVQDASGDGVVSDGGSLVQGISGDGKLMITIARAEGVDWNPLKDLTAKAYQLLDADFNLPPVKIYLEKRSPVGAGLGGGSSDAASAIIMLNTLFSLGLDEAAMASYASRLGSDCAFFIYRRPMFGQGRGEILTDFQLPELEGYELKIVVPEGISVSTSEAYKGIVPAFPEIPLQEVLAKPISQWKELLVNDFEKTVFAAHPSLAAIKQSLYDTGAVYASMSGSGSALFALYAK